MKTEEEDINNVSFMVIIYITLQNSKKKSLRVIIHVAYKKETPCRSEKYHLAA